MNWITLPVKDISTQTGCKIKNKIYHTLSKIYQKTRRKRKNRYPSHKFISNKLVNISVFSCSIAIRVAVNGYMDNFIPYWSNGELVDVDKFCVGTPDEINIANNICLFMTHSSENWCGSNITRLDDASCDERVLRICMEREE